MNWKAFGSNGNDVIHHPIRLQRSSNSTNRLLPTEVWLDQGHGNCELRTKTLRDHLVNALHQFDDDRYELGAYVIMPNHVHVIVRPLQCSKQPLESILKSWKQYSSRQIHDETGDVGALWQAESYDRIIRDEEHLHRCLQYIGNNPRKANLSSNDYIRWVRPAWVALGWNFVS